MNYSANTNYLRFFVAEEFAIFFELCQLLLHMQGTFVLCHVLHLFLAHLVNIFRLEDQLV